MSKRKNILVALLIGWIALLVSYLVCMPEAGAVESLSPPGFHLIDLHEVSVDYKSFLPGGHDPLITDNGLPNRTLGIGLDLNVNMDIGHYFYWDNTIHSVTDQVGSDGTGQFREVGLEFGTGLDVRKITPYLPVTVGYYHYSQHCLDCTYPWHSPVKDAIEVKLYLYGGDAHK